MKNCDYYFIKIKIKNNINIIKLKLKKNTKKIK